MLCPAAKLISMLALVGCLVSFLTATAHAGADLRVGSPAPALIVTDLNGQKFDLASERGQVVIVTFWATWCGLCRQEMPALNAFYRHHHNDGVDLIALSLDTRHDRGDVLKTTQQYAFPVGLLCDAKSSGFGTPRSLLAAYVIDSAGIVHAEYRGGTPPFTEQTLSDVVLPLLVPRSGHDSQATGQMLHCEPHDKIP